MLEPLKATCCAGGLRPAFTGPARGALRLPSGRGAVWSGRWPGGASNQARNARAGADHYAPSPPHALVIPRRWPEYPGRRLGWFIAGTLVLFVATLAAVEVFAKESEAAEEHAVT